MRKHTNLCALILVGLVSGWVQSLSARPGIKGVYDAVYRQPTDVLVVVDGWSEREYSGIDGEELADRLVTRLEEIIEGETNKRGSVDGVKLILPKEWEGSRVEREIRTYGDGLRETGIRFVLSPLEYGRIEGNIFHHVYEVITHAWGALASENGPPTIFVEQFVGGERAIRAGAQMVAAAGVLPDSVRFTMQLHGGFYLEEAPDSYRVEHLAFVVAKNLQLLRGDLNHLFFDGKEPVVDGRPDPRSAGINWFAALGLQGVSETSRLFADSHELEQLVREEMVILLEDQRSELTARLEHPEHELIADLRQEEALVSRVREELVNRHATFERAFEFLKTPLERMGVRERVRPRGY